MGQLYVMACKIFGVLRTMEREEGMDLVLNL